MRKKLIFLIIAICFLTTACHRFSSEIDERIEMDKVNLALEMEKLYGESTADKTLKWVIQTSPSDSVPSLKGVNQYLKSIGKDYEVTLVTFRNQDKIKIGDNYYDYLEKELTKGDIDIINFGVKHVPLYEYPIFVSEGLDPEDYREDRLSVIRLIDNGYVVEIDSKYAVDKATLIDGKCFGFGNFIFKGPIGFIWYDEIVNEEEAVKLSPNPWENMDLLMEYKEKLGIKPVFLLNDFTKFTEGLKLYLDLLVVDHTTGAVNYVFDTPEYKKLAEGILQLRQNELLVEPNELQGTNINYAPAVESGFLMNMEILDKINENVYRVRYQSREGYFVKYTYPYQIRNYMNLENGISKNSKYIDEALDFLNLMYNDENLISIFYEENRGLNLNKYCNEWLIEDISKILNEYGEMDSYLNYYKNDLLEGFDFDDSADEIQSSIPNALNIIFKDVSENVVSYSDDYDSYRFMSENYKSACENIRRLLEESGGKEAKEFFQNQVNKFIK